MKTTSRSEFLDQLAAKLPMSTPQYNLYGLFFGWLAAAWFFSIAMVLVVAPMRANWNVQLLSSEHFSVEMFLGLSAGVLTALVAFQSAVPGIPQRLLQIISVTAGCLWVASFLVGFYFPALTPSMEGKRAFCDVEILVYSIPVMASGFYFLKKGYVLNWRLAGFGIGLASGLIPALIMQLACMYSPTHALVCHILPAVALGVVGLGVGWNMSITSRK